MTIVKCVRHLFHHIQGAAIQKQKLISRERFFIFFKTGSRYNANPIFSLKAFLGQEWREGGRDLGSLAR